MVNEPQEHPLRRWRKSEGLTLEEATTRLDAVWPEGSEGRASTARQVWSDWERGRRRPSSEAMTAIYVLTGAQVQPNDFYELPQSDTSHVNVWAASACPSIPDAGVGAGVEGAEGREGDRSPADRAAA